MVRLVREVVYLAIPQAEWLKKRAEEKGISWQEFLRSIVRAAKEADEEREARLRHGPPPDPPRP